MPKRGNGLPGRSRTSYTVSSIFKADANILQQSYEDTDLYIVPMRTLFSNAHNGTLRLS